MDHVKKDHEKHVAAVEAAFREKISQVEEKGANENAEITAKFEKKIGKLETDSNAKITGLKESLEQTLNKLEAEHKAYTELNTKHQLLTQANEENKRDNQSLKS